MKQPVVPDVVQIGRLPLPGLDPDRRYRVRPVTVGQQPRGLSRPAWWGGPAPVRIPGVPAYAEAWRAWPTEALDGVVLSRAALGGSGLMAPGLHPEQAVLLELRAVD